MEHPLARRCRVCGPELSAIAWKGQVCRQPFGNQTVWPPPISSPTAAGHPISSPTAAEMYHLNLRWSVRVLFRRSVLTSQSWIILS